jgi:parallel beta-helix repeat protein
MKPVRFKYSLVFVVFSSFFVGLATSSTLYVNNTATGANDGSSWTDAYTDLQNALTASNSGDQIQVAAGTYYPSVQIGGTDPRYATFQMKNGVSIYGGFAGAGADPNQRDTQNNPSILSGDIGAPGDTSDNCYHIFYHLTGLNLDSSAILDGFTLTAGNANGPTATVHRYGGGMYNENSSPTVRNCAFSGNMAYWNGGGIYNFASSPIITQCTFSDNLAYNGGGITNEQGSPVIIHCVFTANTGESAGGGVYNNGQSSSTVSQCTFYNNTAPYGGGLVNYESTSTITNCVFAANHGNSNGGGIWNSFSSPAITNCIFAGNSAYYGGGGIRNYYQSNPTIINCTLIGNTAINTTGSGGGIANSNSSNPTLANCILWGNSAALDSQIFNDQSTPIVAFSDIEGGYVGDGNIDSDPLLTNATGPDGTLGTADDDLRLSYLSPCRDSGSDALLPPDYADLDDNGNTTEPVPYDLQNQTRIIDGDCSGTATVDMGALEYNPKQTGDLNSDCQIDLTDFNIFAQAWQTTPQDSQWNPDCDLAFPADGTITLDDFNIIAIHWLDSIPLNP